MADSTHAIPETSTEVGSYRPLSGLALASIAIAGLYAVVVLAFALMAIVFGNPVFLSPWALACPTVAGILAAAARWQIRNSEGALSGNGYGVVIPYRITTPDGTYVIQFTLRSKDSKESRKRRWRVIMKDNETQIVDRELTPLGEKMLFWQSMAGDFGQAWLMLRT